MKAAVCYEYGKPLVIEEVDISPPQPGQVKVRMAATAICHSDIHAFKGEIPQPLPFVGGHESAGYIAEVGEGVTSVKPGDPVVASLLASCGKCSNCLSGLPHLCETMSPFIPASCHRNKKGQSLWQSVRIGSYSEYTIIHESQVVKIPADLPMEVASLLACGFITGYGAVVNRAQVRPLSSVVVIGVGGVGLSSIQGAKISGAYPIIAVDVLDNKLQSSLNFGATHTVNAKKEDAVEAVKKLTGGRGADYVFVTVGSVSAVVQSVAMLKSRGTAVIVGMAPVQEMMTLSPLQLIDNERTLMGCVMGSTNLHVDIPRIIALYRAGQIKLDEYITGKYPLNQINEAIASVERGEALRNVIVF